MGKFQLGEFEEIVMLTVGVLHGDAYGVSIKREIEERFDRKVSVGALQSALRRLGQKGYLTSEEGECTSVRGGRPKRYFTITVQGKNAVDYSRQKRNELWNAIPQVVLDLKIA